MGTQTGTATMENSMEGPQIFNNRVTAGPSKPSSEYLPPQIENIFLQRYGHLYAHRSTIMVTKTYKQPTALP